MQKLSERVREKIKTRVAQAGVVTHQANGKPAESHAERVFYDSGRKTYWLPNTRGEWMDVTTASLRLFLRNAGMSGEFTKGDPNPLTPLEQEMFRIQHNCDVHYAGPLAGYPVGLYDVGGNRVLVTRGRKTVEPRKGRWPVLSKFLIQLLGDQRTHVLCWLKAAVEALQAGPPFRPGQMLALAGPAGCGKSLLQGLITELLGGRTSKPYRYLTGQTAFNSDLFTAEHLAIEDEAASTDLRTRRMFGAQLKNLIVNETQSFHAKGRDALTLTPFWRVSVTLNDEPENLMVLPPLDDSLKDKVLLLRAHPTKLPFGKDDLDGRRDFRAELSKELPEMLYDLFRMQVPTQLADQRYGVKAYHDPGLLEALEDLAPEHRLLQLCDGLGLFSDFAPAWEGTAAELERQLREKDKTGEVGRLLNFNSACGMYLGRLKKKYPGRVSNRREHSGRQKWKIEKS